MNIVDAYVNTARSSGIELPVKNENKNKEKNKKRKKRAKKNKWKK